MRHAPGRAPDARSSSTSPSCCPVYNEKGHLRGGDRPDPGRARTRREYSFEIIVVDDGSNDGSGEPLREIEGIRLIQFAQNRGSGSARKAGTHAARGRVVVWTDVDMTYPNDEIPQLVKELEGYDQVVGARTSEQGTAKLRPRAGQVVHPQARRATSSRRRSPTSTPGMRAFRADVAPPVPPPAAARASRASPRITMAFLANGYSVKYVPDRVLGAGRAVEVPLVERHPALPHPGRAHGAVVQPAAGVPAARPAPGRVRPRQARPRLDRRTTSGSPPTRC